MTGLMVLVIGFYVFAWIVGDRIIRAGEER